MQNFVGSFDGACGSLADNVISLGDLGEIGEAVNFLTREATYVSQSNSITSGMAVSMNLV